MTDDLPPRFQARREIEDTLSHLGAERQRLDEERTGTISEIVYAISFATEAGISCEEIAQLVGVSRQTLHRWHVDVKYAPSGEAEP